MSRLTDDAPTKTYSMKDVKDFFNADTTRAVTTAEFAAFWKDCSDALKAELKNNLAEINF